MAAEVIARRAARRLPFSVATPGDRGAGSRQPGEPVLRLSRLRFTVAWALAA